MIKSGALYKLKGFIHLWNTDDGQRFDRKGEAGENIIIISMIEERRLFALYHPHFQGHPQDVRLVVQLKL